MATRRIRYCCAVSLDGCIAGPGGEFDWIVMDPDMDFAGLSEQFDTYLLGRKTFEATGGRDQSSSGVRTFVFSRTLRQSDYNNVTIVGENCKELVQSLREEPGRDIWLFGGGSLATAPPVSPTAAHAAANNAAPPGGAPPASINRPDPNIAPYSAPNLTNRT
ncbi:MAG: hypothetical protein F4137_16555 [Acidobacteria bacterium]|nr:hypothetical protein [Acidobacteriota bacterium]